jgi:hypothetical protein
MGCLYAMIAKVSKAAWDKVVGWLEANSFSP